MPCFRNCSTCKSHSKAPLCHYTLQLISIQLEGTFGTLRYSLVRNLPSQTAHLILSYLEIIENSKKQSNQREVLHWRLLSTLRLTLKVSLLCSTLKTLLQHQVAVKLPGSFCPGAGRPHLHSHFNFAELFVKTVPKSLRLSCGTPIKRRGISLP